MGWTSSHAYLAGAGWTRVGFSRRATLHLIGSLLRSSSCRGARQSGSTGVHPFFPSIGAHFATAALNDDFKLGEKEGAVRPSLSLSVA